VIFYNRSKGFVKIKTSNLVITMNHQSCLMLSSSALVYIVLDSRNPFTTYGFLSWQEIFDGPSVILLKCLNFFSHRLTPFWIFYSFLKYLGSTIWVIAAKIF